MDPTNYSSFLISASNSEYRIYDYKSEIIFIKI